MTFVYRAKPSEVAEQKRISGNPPKDMVDPFNYPYKLRSSWQLHAVQGNVWRVRLQEDQVMTGGNVDTSVAEGNWNFEHVVRDFYFYQYVTATGVRDDTRITWEWARRIGNDFYPIRAEDNQSAVTIAIEEVNYRSNDDDYRWRFNGNPLNSVAMELWVEVLRI